MTCVIHVCCFFLAYHADLCEDYMYQTEKSMCSALPGYTTQQVLVRRGKTISGQAELEKDMLHTVELVKFQYKLTEGCEDLLVMALCQATFPFCQNDSEDEALKLCSDHCQLLENLNMFCPDAYGKYNDYVTSHAALVSSTECDLVTDTNSLCLSLPPPPGTMACGLF